MADGPTRWVYVVRGGRIRAVAVAERKLGRAALRDAVGRLLSARATQARTRYVPGRAESSGRMLGRALAGTYDPELNAAFARLCKLGYSRSA